MKLSSLNRSFLACALLLPPIANVGCTPLPKEEKEKKLDLPDQLVARVSSVYEEEGYALIQRYGRLEIPEAAILYSLGLGGKVANLKATGEKLGQFIAVDILSGELEVGDGVYLRKFDKKSSEYDQDEQDSSSE